MRKIDLIVIHCSATRCNRDFPVTALIRCHADRFGFTGYHYYITRDGTVYQTRHEQLVGAHAKGYNSRSLGVCYEGGLNAQGKPEDTRTKAQKWAMTNLLKYLIKKHPDAQILGHRDLPNVHKDCPCFDVKAEYAGITI
ncbi:N-acetylmuramoyl-L-alanine amidase [Prevotella sp. E15-22]|uniref:N-acetylmuramoyl-L-alanine amidase n=1 Tax=Prevotella sp. E15-22 TaxID=2937774 RepID=UPI00205BCDAA|nr:N-acetylmuramoyl-L-alanine amidase [Prevotella sp. E15-22]UPS45026.1 N-acetylmuramoyl-L-alanine amidase [Prevotella sp. E15-22]